MINNIFRKIDFIFIILILLVSIYIFQFNFVYPIGDEVNMISLGKWLLNNPSLIFSFELNMFYRPIQRFIWMVNYMLFNINFIPIQIFKRILFIGLIINIYNLAKYFAGKKAGLITSLLFLGLPLTTRFFETFFVARLLGLFFLTGSIYLLLIFMKSGRKNGLFLSFLLAILAFLSYELSIFIFPAVMLVLFFYSPPEQKKKIFPSFLIFSAFILIYVFFYYYNFKDSPFLKGWVSQWLNQNGYLSPILIRIKQNFHFYFFNVLSPRFSLVVTFLIVFSLTFFKKSSHHLFLSWAIISLIPILFLSFHTDFFFLESFTGLVIFSGITLSFLLDRIIARTKVCLKDRKGYLIVSTYLMLLIFIMVNILPDVARNYRQIEEAKYWTKATFKMREERVNTLLSLPLYSKVFVSKHTLAEMYYKIWLELGDRKDIKISTVTPEILEEITDSENLLKNTDFEKKNKGWKSHNFEGISFVTNEAYSGKFSLKVSKTNIENFYSIFQRIRVNPGQNYIFGGWMRIKNMYKWAFFEVQNDLDWRYGNWATPPVGGYFDTTKWKFVSASFPTSFDVNKVKFFPCRIPEFFRGDVLVDDVFLYKLKDDVIFLNYR